MRLRLSPSTTTIARPIALVIVLVLRVNDGSSADGHDMSIPLVQYKATTLA
jgi:hypothetical protein